MSTQNAAILARYRFAPAFAIPKSPVRGLNSVLPRVFRAIATHYRIKRNIAELKAISPEALRDIGVERAEIMSLVHEKAHGNRGRRHGRD